MAKTRGKGRSRSLAAGRDRPRARKSGAPEALGTGSRKLNPTKLTLRKQKPSPASETVWLQEQLKTARLQQEATAEILRAVANAAGDAAHALQLIAETTARLFCASSVAIRIAENGRWARKINVGEGSHRITAAVPPDLLTIDGHNLPGMVFRENRQIHMPDVDNPDPAYADLPGIEPAREAGTRVISGTPLRRGSEAIGVLVIHRGRLVPFTPEELALQQSFANQAAIAIENARLSNDTQKALSRQTASGDILRVISQSPTDVQPVFDAIVQTVVRLVGCETAFIQRCDGKHFWSVARCMREDGLVTVINPRPVPIDPNANFPSRAIVNRTTLHLPDWSQIELPEFERRVQEQLGYRSAVYLPLLRDEECIGVLGLAGSRPGMFGETEIALAESFRDQALIAIENTRLFNETNAALERQTATSDILKVIASSPSDLQPVFDAIAERSKRLMGGFSSMVLRIFGGMAHLAAFTSTGETGDAAVKAMYPRPTSDIFVFDSLRDGEVVQVEDVETSSQTPARIKELARLRGYRSIIHTPLISKGVLVGIVIVSRKNSGKFEPRHVELLKTFANQAVIAIENARLLNELRERTTELSQSLDELRTAQDRLIQTQKLASLGELTAGIAHEIKNPLNFVNNFSAVSAELVDELNDALKSAALDDKTRDEVGELAHMLKSNLEKIVQHGKRADSIVKNMLLHSREGSGERRPADINAIVEESLNLAYHGARAEKSDFYITLQRDLDPAAGIIDLYPQEITRVLLNLISNGFYAVNKRKAIDDGGFEPSLMATTKNLGNRVEIRIRDNGTGIPPEVKEKMFNPFFTTKPAGEGTGLGLSMSHDIVVKQHGGKIEVDTEPGQFTEFIITLPRAVATKTQAGVQN